MYHDEFARRPSRISPSTDVDVPAIALEFGGGLSLGLMASLNPPASAMLFGLGGLVPLVASSFAIALHRGSEILGGLAPSPRVEGPKNLPAPHLRPISYASTRPRANVSRFSRSR